MGRWAQARRRGTAQAATLPVLPQPDTLVLSESPATGGDLQVAWSYPVTPHTVLLELFDVASPGVTLTSTNYTDTGSGLWIIGAGDVGVTYQCRATAAKPGYSSRIDLSNTKTYV